MWDTEKKRAVTVTHAFIVRHSSDLDTGNFVPKGVPHPANMSEGARKDTPQAGAQITVTYDLAMDPQFHRYLRVIEAWAKHDPVIDSETMDRSRWMTPDWVAESGQYTVSSQLFQKHTPFNHGAAVGAAKADAKGTTKNAKGSVSKVGGNKKKTLESEGAEEADREEEAAVGGRLDTTQSKQGNQTKPLKYDVHDWIKNATVPANPQWIPNPARTLFFERIDKKQTALAKSDIPRLRGGDLVKSGLQDRIHRYHW
ncbi:hypothetical protein FA13DRAFT_760029 [Coprinellus micaceus]|uniref:Uncharacterized protein n=1 Tax=Coprinellus micaceus TaxID=71717 RepID=A0A4Y7T3R9_COPMI|nr:hypothetical protein FA13DRAFT_760029 [Coprinellus micaceus]